MPTPLINSLRVTGGTLYTFTSASNDISKTFVEDDNRFVFSKFVLLDIPNVATPSSGENRIVWESIGATVSQFSSVPLNDITSDNNINFAQSFQNYVLNLEQLILQGSNNLGREYNQEELYTTSERIFWKWMASINAIRFRNASASESLLSRIVEEDSASTYSKVVKYIGDIDVVNNVSRGGQSYSEVYMNVPVNHGSTPLVLFKTLSDSNYSASRIITGSGEFISGRDSGSVHPTGLSLSAYYDDDSNNQYVLKSVFGDVSNFIGSIQADGGSLKPIKRSEADGLILDTNPSSYKPITDNFEISSISEFNASDQSSDFSFNAVLVYYDTYDPSTPENRGRNLYGILILDDYVNEGAGVASLKRYDKFKPNPITKLNGNGYGLKLNVKFDTSINNVGVETIINDYNTFSMDLFIDASTRMQETADIFLNQVNEIREIKQKISQLETFYFAQDSLNEIKLKISQIETSINNSNSVFSTNSTLLDLINKNADNINLILSGNLSTSLTYNMDILKGGDGILIDRSVPNEFKVINRNQNYNFSTCQNLSGFLSTDFGNGKNLADTNLNNILTLNKYNNYFKQINQDPNPLTGLEDFDDDLLININDHSNKWKTGQIMRIVFEDPINTNGQNIIIKTDEENIFNNGIYGITIGIIYTPQLISNRPIFEIICTDESQYKFNIDILR